MGWGNALRRWAVLAVVASAWVGGARGGGFVATNLVTDDPAANPAALTDPALKNAWGLSATASGPFWVSANGSGVSTLYRVDPATNAPTKLNLTVTIPGDGSVTGQVTNPVGAGAFNGDAFLFVNEDGTVSGWRGALGTTAEILQTGSADNLYTGVTAAAINGHGYLYSANFATGLIDVMKGDGLAPDLTGKFVDPNLPANYAPFNVANLAGTIFVAYALTNGAGGDQPGTGHGLVSAFDLQGNLLGRVGTAGALNSPWGLAIAPSSFGEFAGDLLVGNHGDGRINVYDPSSQTFLGQLTGADGQPIVIDGLWGLRVGNGVGAGSDQAVYFTAGPGGGTHGLFGVIQAVPEPSTWVMVAISAAGLAVATGRRRPAASAQSEPR